MREAAAGEAPKAGDRPADPWIAVAGNPNTGKSALFNRLTGLRQKVGNYPGVTVERKLGTLRLPSGRSVRCVDLPGCYSLVPRSEDERVAHDALVGRIEDMPEPDVVLLVLDASNLERNLYLASQISDIGLPMVVALNMADVADRAGITIDAAALARFLGAPVITTVATRGSGLQDLGAALEAALGGEPAPARPRSWRMPDAVERRVADLASFLVERRAVAAVHADAEANWLLASSTGEGETRLAAAVPAPPDAAIASRVLALQRDLAAEGTPFRPVEIAARYSWIESVVAATVRRGQRLGIDWTARLDAAFTHRIAGPAIFLGLMALVFQSIFAGADPAISAIEALFAALTDAARSVLPSGALRDLLTEGIIAGAGNVVVFLPQILLLFLAISLLEDSGYMARAAYMMDKVMGRAGLNGRAFIPLLSSFACAIPGIMATRTIEDRRDRLVTILVAPLMSCSARLPVYALVISALFDAGRRVAGPFTVGGLVLLGMYLLSIAAALAMATTFKRTILRGPRPPLVLEMPPYRMPSPRAVASALVQRCGAFLGRAGTVIVAVTILLWALLSYPQDVALSRDFAAERARIETGGGSEEERRELVSRLRGEEDGERLRASWGGRLGRVIEPAIAPLGFDWKIGIGLLGSFAAREVLVSTLGVVYGVGEADEESTPLRDRLRAERRPDGTPVYTPLVGLSLMVFFVLACQCVSTLAVVRRETGGWPWPLFMLAYMTVLAWLGSFVTYQGGRLLGLS